MLKLIPKNRPQRQTESSMNRQDVIKTLKSLFRTVVLKGLLLYVLFPLLCLWLLAGPIGSAVRGSDAAAFLILLAALVCVGLNWLVYSLVRRTRPSLLVFSYGVFCLLAVLLVEYDALPASSPVASTLAVIGGCLALTGLFLLSYWFAARRSKPAHVFAVGLWIIIGIIAVFMGYQVIRDFESRYVTRDTWITLVILLALLPAAFIHRILSIRRAKVVRQRAAGLAEGRILQLIGETRLDQDDDLVTNYHARIEYEVNGAVYETRADIAKITMRRFGKKAFVGQKIPVHYDPANPANAYADRIDRHFFDQVNDYGQNA